MAQYKVYEQGIMVNGPTILSVANGMSKFKDMAEEILADNGLSNVKEDGWYPQQSWLNAFKSIAEEVGEATLFSIGKAILESAQFPPQIDAIEKGLSAIDVAYHMNHSKNGAMMFDPSNGTMQEGIGHYIFQSTGPNTAKVIGDTPYPCDFDRGIVTAMARKFQALAEVTVDTSVETKKAGGNTSTYLVKW